MIRNLVDLLHPVPEVKFLEHYEHKKPLQIRGDREKIAALLDLNAIDRLLNAGALSPANIRLYRSGKRIPEIMYLSKEKGLSAEAVQGILRKGASLVLNNIGPLVPALAALERNIERRLRGVTCINAYLGINKGSAFAAHYDNHEVLIVQVLGSKHWELLGEPERPSISVKPCRPPPACNRDVTWQDTLHQGELMYVPRGTWHRATLYEGGVSLHLTITIMRPNGIDYLKWLLEQAKKDDFIASDLPLFSEGADLSEFEAKLHARINSIMDKFKVGRFCAAVDGDRQADAGFNFSRDQQCAAEDVLVSNLRRPLAELQNQPEASIDMHLNGQPHRFSPLLAAVLHAIDGAEDGLQRKELVRRLAEKWSSDDILDAARKLAEMGLVMATQSQFRD